MRKRLIIVATLITVTFFVLCYAPLLKKSVTGIQNYRPADCSVSLSQNLFPCEDFLTRFPYYEGDYQYYHNGKMVGGYATSFSYLRYVPDEYEKAKAFCISEFAPTDEHQFQIGDYIFIEHLCYTKENADGEYVIACDYPDHFNMFAYNDARSTLLFLGYYQSSDSSKKMFSDFEAFYNEVFSQYYMLD